MFSIWTILPFTRQLHHFIQLYSPVLDSDIPQLTLAEHELRIRGDLPKIVELENDVQVIFHEEIIDSLFADVPAQSVYISSRHLWYKTATDTIKLSFESIQAEEDSVQIQPAKIKGFLNRYSSLIIWGMPIVLFPFSLLLFYLISLFFGGIGIMIDAFQNGPYSFSIYLNLGSLVVFLFLILWFGLQLSSATHLAILVGILVLGFLLSVFLLIRHGLQKMQRSNL